MRCSTLDGTDQTALLPANSIAGKFEFEIPLRGHDASIGRMIFHRGRSQSQYFLKCEKANLVVKFQRTLRIPTKVGGDGWKKGCDFVTVHYGGERC